MRSQRRPPHPGAILKRTHLHESGLSIKELSAASGISIEHLTEIIEQSASIDSDTANKLAKSLGTTPDLWINLQNKFDLYSK